MESVTKKWPIGLYIFVELRTEIYILYETSNVLSITIYIGMLYLKQIGRAHV